MLLCQVKITIFKISIQYYAFCFTDNLRREISFYCCKSLLRNVNIFRDLPDRILKEMVRRMDSEIYLPNDIIVKAGSIGRCMYFLVSGTVAVFTANGKEVKFKK